MQALSSETQKPDEISPAQKRGRRETYFCCSVAYDDEPVRLFGISLEENCLGVISERCKAISQEVNIAPSMTKSILEKKYVYNQDG